jgi:hypothetical protein
MHVADVPGVVVPGDRDHVGADEPLEVLAGLAVLLLVAEGGEVARADDHVGRQVVDLHDRPLEQVLDEVRRAAVQVGEVRDHERARLARHARHRTAVRGARYRCKARMHKGPRFQNDAERECARLFDYHGVAWEYEPHTFPLEVSPEGGVLEAFTPDFYLPEQDLYVEVTTMKQSLVTKKNRKGLRLPA